MPARSTNRGLAADAPVTPMTSDRLLTSPSLTPKMTARSVPDRELRRCHGSYRPTSAADTARLATATPSRRHASSGLSLARRSQIWACSRSSAAMAATSGEASWASYASSSSPSRALTRSATERVPNRRAISMMNRTRGRGPSGGGTVAPSSVSLPAQMSAWRRSFDAIRRNASARVGSFSISASASYRTIASRSSLRFSRLVERSMGATRRIVPARPVGPRTTTGRAPRLAVSWNRTPPATCRRPMWPPRCRPSRSGWPSPSGR